MTKEKMREYMKSRYNEQRRMFIAYLGGKCVRCGATDDLQFDHRDPAEKAFDVGHMRGMKQIPKVLKELDKCQLLCGTCHRNKSAQERSERQQDTFKHGTIYAWMKRKCACTICYAAKRLWHDKRNQARRITDRDSYARRF